MSAVPVAMLIVLIGELCAEFFVCVCGRKPDPEFLPALPLVIGVVICFYQLGYFP